MEWYYAEGTEQKGPVSGQDIENLYKSGRITMQTLVWREGMDQWAELETVVPRKKVDNSEPEPEPASDPQLEQEPEIQETALKQKQMPSTEPLYRCCECSRNFTEDEVISYDGAIVCGACKPVFLMKLKQGMQVSGTVSYAGFGIRLMAKIIDWIVLMVAQTLIFIPVFLVLGLGGKPDPEESADMITGFMGIIFFIQTALPLVYTTWFVGKYAATPGKMICKLKIVRSSQEKVSYPRALARAFAEWISGSIFAIGYFMALFDEQNRTLHDRICDTLVIHSN